MVYEKEYLGDCHSHSWNSKYKADKLSQKFQDSVEWQLKPNVLNLRWGQPDIDLFASRHNCKFKPFASWHADPDATDAIC